MWRAWTEAHSIRTVWRMAYDMPPTDPRVLDADESTIVRDLMVRLYHTHEQRKIFDPKGAAAAEGPPKETLREQFRELERQATEGELAQNIKRFEASRNKKATGRQLNAIRLSVGTRPPPAKEQPEKSIAERLVKLNQRQK